MKDDKPNVAEQTKKFFEEKITSGYKVEDKNHVIDLTNEAMDTLKIPRGSYGRTKKILSKVLVDKGIVIKGQGLKQSGTLKIDFVGERPAPTTQPATQTPTAQSAPQTTTATQAPYKFLGEQPAQNTQQQNQQQQNQQQKILPPLTEGDKPRYERKFTKFVRLGQKLYIKFGIITEEQKKELENDYDDFSKDLADYCIENNVRLPMHVELYLIFAQGIMLFGVPLIKWMFKPKKKDDKDGKDKKE